MSHYGHASKVNRRQFYQQEEGGVGSMKEKDYYKILGIDRSADEKKIKSAYRRLAKKYHPDTNAGNQAAEQKFKEVTEAYNVLSDPEKKKLYDQYGSIGLEEGFDPKAYEAYRNGGFTGFNGRQAGGFGSGSFGNGGYTGFGGFGNGSFGDFSGGTSGPDGSYREFHFNGSDADDILNNLFGGMFSGGGSGARSGSGRRSGDSAGGGYGTSSGSAGYGGYAGGQGNGYGSAFRQGSNGYNRSSGTYGNRTYGSGADFSRSGEENHTREAENKDSRDMESGDITAEAAISFEEAAFGCRRTLHLKDKAGITRSLEVQIPAGIDDGQKIRLKGKGRQTARGTGDLFLKVQITPKEGYERKGADVYVTTTIPYPTAVLGGEALVKTLYGDVLCKIPAGTQSGSKIRLKGKGIVSMKDPAVHGDEYAVIRIAVPKNLSAAAQKALREFQREAGI